VTRALASHHQTQLKLNRGKEEPEPEVAATEFQLRIADVDMQAWIMLHFSILQAIMDKGVCIGVYSVDLNL
jgi:hypothetical protein